ncbi:protein MTL1-like isoform X2 [Haliotis rubra]|uniref:protein MTL1-like isoform X2 n=1 Tax=Haliotis rubra TaxID=36100 RepID=UPI001EE5339F|nr:protein MTL1-like isoform X2 [Haliotis rubra]
MGNNNINRFSVSCNDTVHSIQFRFNSTTDQGGWQCGKLVNINHIYPRSNIQSVGVASPVMSTQSSSTTTRYTETTAESGTVTSQNDGVSLVTSTQSTQSLPTTTWYTETTIEPGTVTPQKGEFVLTSSPVTATDGELFTLICSVSSGSVVNIIWIQNNTTKVLTQHSNSCIKQPSPMGNYINRFSVSCNDTVHSIDFMFNSTTDQGGWQCGKFVNDTYIYPRSNIHSVVAARHVISTQTSSTTIRYTETTSEPGTVTPQEVATDVGDSDTIYIVVGAVGGAVLLAVVVVGIICIRRRREGAHHQNDMKQERHVEATPVYQNTISFHTDSSAAVTNPENTQQDDPIVSEDVNTQNMYESLTSVEMHIYRRLK